MAAPCPFCALPQNRIVHATELVLAIRDAYPVTPGHTLVVPRRHIASYFEASPTEAAALWEAVAAVKAELDRTLRPAPDGYNVGFNVGETAGQTVAHAHIHVIPRYRGDVPNPRGGVRWVIPSKADYVASHAHPLVALADGREHSMLPWLERDLSTARTVDIAVAFVFGRGVDALYPYLEECLERGGRLRLITGDYRNATEPDALRRLLDLGTNGGDAQFRVFGSERVGRSFHPKAYLVSGSRDAAAVAYVGSSNLSKEAFTQGIEWNLRVEEPGGVQQAHAAFEELFVDPATRALDHAWIDAYEKRRAKAPKAHDYDFPEEPLPPPPEPHEILKEALAALADTRVDGNTAGLVVMATGIGKTWLSACDSLSFKRVLFVAHREEILTQARNAYRRFRPATDRLGFFIGDKKDRDADVLFASIQTLSRSANLRAFDPRHFDYVVVDEFHHACARTYRDLIAYFEPKFLLGLTATPDRTDGGDLLALCDGNLVYECHLADGIRRGRLCPFAYHGVPDLVDYENIPWRSRKFDEKALAEAVETRARADNALEQWRKHKGSRTLGFCVSQTHADFMKAHFAAAGVRVASVHSGPSSDPRVESLERLERGELDVIFAVDMFNEGVDVRAIDTVLMLRPTESRILWLQQIGRGLRKTDEQKTLSVIDYIGNHRVFLEKPAALLGALGVICRTHAEVVAKIASNDIELPPGCSVTYELEAKSILEKLAPPRRSQDALPAWYEEFRGREGVRPTALEAFEAGYNPRTVGKTHGSWLHFVEAMGDLDDAHSTVLRRNAGLLVEVESTPMTRSYKMVVLEAMLWLDAFGSGATVSDLAQAFARVARRSLPLRTDVSVELDDPAAVESLVRKNPIAAWLGRRDKLDRPFFTLVDDRFAPGPAVDLRDVDVLCDLLGEIVEWRLARYVADHRSGVRLKLLRSGGKPILKIDRVKHQLPEGWADVLVDGETHEANFVKHYVNVLRRKGGGENVMTDVMTRWFGGDAGKPGTGFAVSHQTAADGTIEWKPVKGGAKAREGTQIRDPNGVLIDARFSVEPFEGATTVVYMSRGGSGDKALNRDYNDGLEIVLERLRSAGATLTRIAVDSNEAQRIPLDERTLDLSPWPCPLPLATVEDVHALRKRIGSAASRVASTARRGGNPNKRLRLWVETTLDLAALARTIREPR